MDSSQGGDLIVPRFPIIFGYSRLFWVETFSTLLARPLGLWSINQVLKWHKMPLNRCFCSEHIVLASLLLLFYYTLTLHMPTPFLTVSIVHHYTIIITNKAESSFTPFVIISPLWMQLMKPQWNGPLRSCIDQFYFEGIFHFLINGNCIWSVLLWRRGPKYCLQSPL